jgi:PAS domain S-box-containing protein
MREWWPPDEPRSITIAGCPRDRPRKTGRRRTIPASPQDRRGSRRSAPGRTSPAASDVTERTQFDARFREFLADIDLGALMLDPSGKVLFINDHLLALLGRTREEMLGRDWIDTVVPEPERPALRTVFDEGIAAGSLAGHREDRITTSSGLERRLSWTSVLQRDADGSVTAIAGIAHDVTDGRRAEAERATLVAAIEQSAESVIITDKDAWITYVNSAFERISGYPSREAIGRNPRFLKSGAQSATFFDAMWAALTNGLPWVADMTNRRKDGSLYHQTSVLSPIRAEDRSITGYVAVGRDVSRERELETQAELLTRERALIADTLQRLPSGGTVEATAELFCRQVGSLTDVVVTALIIFESDGTAIPLAFVAPDGHEVGRLRHAAGRSRYLRERAETGPWVEAWRGHHADPFAESLRRAGAQAIAYAPVAYEGSVIGVLAVASAEDEAMAQLSGQLGAIVDFANLAGALLGRRVGDTQEGRRLRAVIERAIAERSFSTVFQPIVDIVRGRTLGYEALTRFTDGVAPDVRFADAAAVGMSVELERATIEAALAAASALSPSRFVHLNVSPALVLDGTDLKRLLGQTKARIVLEITEHAAVGDYAAFRTAIESIGRPVLLAVDDAGAGFASFRHILELRPAFVKLDISIVRGIDSDPAKQALVAGMHHFARMTRRRLIAEGVETEAEANALRALDIRLGQGYLFGPPAPLTA